MNEYTLACFTCWNIPPRNQISIFSAEHSSSNPQLFSSHFVPNEDQKLYEIQRTSCWQIWMHSNQSSISVAWYTNPAKTLLYEVNERTSAPAKQNGRVSRIFVKEKKD